MIYRVKPLSANRYMNEAEEAKILSFLAQHEGCFIAFKTVELAKEFKDTLFPHDDLVITDEDHKEISR